MTDLTSTKARVSHTTNLLKTVNDLLGEIPGIGPVMTKFGSFLTEKLKITAQSEYDTLVGVTTLTGLGWLIYANRPHHPTSDDRRRYSGNKRGKEFEQFMQSFNLFAEDVIERGKRIAEQWDNKLPYSHKNALILFYLSNRYNIGLSLTLSQITKKCHLSNRTVYHSYKTYKEDLFQIDQSIVDPQLPLKLE